MDPEFREQEVEVMTSLSLVSHLEVPGLRASGHTLGEEWSPPPASLKRMSVPNVWPPRTLPVAGGLSGSTSRLFWPEKH